MGANDLAAALCPCSLNDVVMTSFPMVACPSECGSEADPEELFILDSANGALDGVQVSDPLVPSFSSDAITAGTSFIPPPETSSCIFRIGRGYATGESEGFLCSGNPLLTTPK